MSVEIKHRYSGEVIATGAPREVFDDPRVKAAYFEGADA